MKRKINYTEASKDISGVKSKEKSILKSLYFGEKDIKDGNVITHEDAKKIFKRR